MPRTAARSAEANKADANYCLNFFLIKVSSFACITFCTAEVVVEDGAQRVSSL